MKVSLVLLLSSSVLAAQVPPPPSSGESASANSCATVSPEAAKLQFDAATVKAAGPFTPGFVRGPTGGPGSNDLGRWTIGRISLLNLIEVAWELWPDQITGPAWMSDMINNGFAITAVMPPTTTREQYCGMLRNLITERFHFAFHEDTQNRPGYELTVIPGGPKFREFVPQPTANTGPDQSPGRPRLDENNFPRLSPTATSGAAIIMGRSGVRKMTYRGTMAQFARSLAGSIGQANGPAGSGAQLPRVADKTDLAGIYDIHLEFQGAPISLPLTDGAAAGLSTTTPPEPDVDTAPTIFNAVEKQLGLKLQKVPAARVTVFVIDHADQMPADN